MTYGELIELFRTQHPDIDIDEYRPAPGDYTIYVWASNHMCSVWQYNPEMKTFRQLNNFPYYLDYDVTVEEHNKQMLKRLEVNRVSVKLENALLIDGIVVKRNDIVKVLVLPTANTRLQNLIDEVKEKEANIYVVGRVCGLDADMSISGPSQGITLDCSKQFQSSVIPLPLEIIGGIAHVNSD